MPYKRKNLMGYSDLDRVIKLASKIYLTYLKQKGMDSISDERRTRAMEASIKDAIYLIGNSRVVLDSHLHENN